MNRAEKRTAKLALVVDEWNTRHPVGTRVRYWRFTKQGQPSGEGPTNHPATLLGGHTPVAWIDGCTGCVALTHVEVVA